MISSVFKLIYWLPDEIIGWIFKDMYSISAITYWYECPVLSVWGVVRVAL